MNISKKTMNGFSLLEILISLAIIAIVAGTLLMSRNNRGATEVQLAAREIAAQLRLLQNDVLNGKVIGGKNIHKAEMYFDTEGTENKYEIRYYDSGGTQIGEAESFTPKESNIDLGGSVTTGTISFEAPLGKVNYDLGGPNGILLQSKKNTDQKITVCVNDAGNIEEVKDENRYCAGPGGCADNAGDLCSPDSCHNNDGRIDCRGVNCINATAKPAVDATLSGWSGCPSCGVGIVETRTCTGAFCGGDTTCGGAILSQSCIIPACPCSLPWGGTIPSGNNVTAYSSSSVPCGSTCASQTRTCTNGTLSGSFTNQNCSVQACPPPPTPHLAWAGWSATTPFGWHAIFYPSIIDINGPVPFGYACGLNYDCSGVACVAGNLYWNVCCSWMGCGLGAFDCIYTCS